MIYYKSHRWINGKLKKIITDEKNNIIQNPTKEQIACAIPDNRVNVRKTYTDKELLNFLIIFYEENGRIPEQKDFENNPGYPGSTIYYKRFGGWNNALMLTRLGIKKRNKQYTDKELLNFLIIFYEENGRIPVQRDFLSNPEYPHINTYIKRFGGWNNALKLVKMDLSTMIRKGIVETDQQKGRQAEIHVLENDEKGATDLSGKNCGSFADGISRISKGQIYDVKSSKLHEKKYWSFCLNNCVDFYYLLGYDKDHKNLLYKWNVPGDFTEGTVVIGNNNYYTYNIENMKEFEIKQDI